MYTCAIMLLGTLIGLTLICSSLAQNADCSHNKADIVFLLDSSYSEGSSNFHKQLDFVTNFTNNFTIGRDNVQVGIVTFSTHPTTAFHLKDHTTKADLLQAIHNVGYIPGGTETADALQFVRQNSFLPTYGGRYGVPKILVVLTDGQSASPTQTAAQARVLHYTDIKVIAIGIGSGVVKMELASIGSDAAHVFTVPTFNSLQSIQHDIQSAACVEEKNITCENHQADIVFVLDASSSEGTKNFQKQLQFVSNFTESLDVGPGAVQVSLVTFATNIYNQFYLNAYNDSKALQAAITATNYTGGTTNTAAALKFVREHSFLPENGGRGSAVSQLVVVLTDGNSLNHYTTASEARKLHQAGPKAIAVGIGSSVSHQELASIATDAQHVFYVSGFDSLDSIKTELKTATCNVPSPCGTRPTDLVFVLDASSSEGAANFQKQLDFASSFVRQFDIGPSDMQVGLVTYSTTGHNEFYLNTNQDKPSLIAAIQMTRYRGGTTATDQGLRQARYYQFASYHGARPNSNKIVIVMTDGRSNDISKTINEANTLKMANVTLVSVGIGSSVNQYEINSMATDKSHAFMVGSFDILHTLTDDIKDESCGGGEPKPTPAPACDGQIADIVFVLDSSASEGSSNFQKQVNFVRDFAYQFQIGPDDVQVSVVVFSSGVHEQFPLNRYSDQKSLLSAITKITYNSGATYTDRALSYVHDNSFTAAKGARSNATHIVVVITDGQSTHPTLTAKQAAALKNTTSKVIAIGIGSGVDHSELLTIASDSKHALAVVNFDALQTIKSELTYVACKTCGFVSKADIVFLLDASSSEGSANFAKQLDFVSRVVNDFDVGVDHVQIGMVTFSDYANLEFNLNQYASKSALLSAIQKIGYLHGLTNTDEALTYIGRNMFSAANGGRADAKDYLIVLTDGASANKNRTITEANKLKQQNINIMAIGIGTSINKPELVGMASDSKHVFTVSSFDALKTVREDIKAAACEEVITTTTTPMPTTTTTTTTPTPKPTTIMTTEPTEIFIPVTTTERPEIFIPDPTTP